MGNCQASSSPNNAISKDIDKELMVHSRDSKRECKILLLGPGESGKTTIIKQLRIIHTVKFEDDLIISFKENIIANVITSMSALVKALERSNQFDELSEDLQDSGNLITSPKVLSMTVFSPEIIKAIRDLWASPIVKDRFLNKSDVQIIDSASYFFNNLDRVSATDYIPNDTDILFARVRTSGINEIRIQIGSYPLRLVDVGGQKSERRKWIHSFDEVKLIFYVSAISEFDQRMREDDKTNRFEDALKLFDEVLNYDIFQNKTVILFLNKIDLLKEKVDRGVLVSKYFPDFTGGNNFDECKDFFLNKFLTVAKGRKKLYPHFTCATDTESLTVVFATIQKIIVSEIINDIGL